MMSIQKERVLEILNTEDVEGLLALGAPADEYTDEAERVATALGEWQGGAPGEGDIVHLLKDVWANSFNLSEEEMIRRVPGFRRIAQSILENFIGAEG